ncbi:hypothetical protein [Hydrogenophaga sp. NFH-34]|uniref:hypothetical protein n=1 Tax=Hydrogenophaga sp. NFH-34 TaxID=2744446 RepID=UPI002DD440D9|nr:hypothetical protein [Hydrogenophaga sp. NFH-34]
MSKSSWRLPAALLASGLTITLTGCGTLTGIPSHGGGKRFATEQRLVSASIRSSLKEIDVTPLRGKRVALIFDLVADEGGGSLNGGRWSPGLLFSVGTVSSPVTTTTNAFQVYNLADAGSNYSNSASGGGTTTVSNTLQSGSNTSYGASEGTGSSTNTSTGTNTSASATNGSNSSTNTTNGDNTHTSTTTNSGSSTTNGSGTNTSETTTSNTGSGSSSSNTGGTSTNTSYNSSDNGTSTTDGSNTHTSTTTNSGSSTTNGSGTNTSTSTGSGTNSSTSTGSGTSASSGSGTSATSSQSTGGGTNNGQSSTVSTTRNTGSSRSSGGYDSQRQEITPAPTESTTVTKGTKREHMATLQYRGLGEYQNFPVPKSDASLLMGLVRNYMLHNGVLPTTPNDPAAEVLVYVTVDIFGTVRSRFDAFIYNKETVKAETSFEIVAFDREGRKILDTQVANHEAQYQEHYLMWAGPITTQERVYKGQGLLVDFTDVDGSKTKYNESDEIAVREHMGGKN